MYLNTSNSQSSSTIVIISIQAGCTKTLLGRDDESIVRVNSSFPSKILSSVIELLNETLISPAGNITVNGPDL